MQINHYGAITGAEAAAAFETGWIPSAFSSRYRGCLEWPGGWGGPAGGWSRGDAEKQRKAHFGPRLFLGGGTGSPRPPELGSPGPDSSPPGQGAAPETGAASVGAGRSSGLALLARHSRTRRAWIWVHTDRDVVRRPAGGSRELEGPRPLCVLPKRKVSFHQKENQQEPPPPPPPKNVFSLTRNQH